MQWQTPDGAGGVRTIPESGRLLVGPVIFYRIFKSRGDLNLFTLWKKLTCSLLQNGTKRFRAIFHRYFVDVSGVLGQIIFSSYEMCESVPEFNIFR